MKQLKLNEKLTEKDTNEYLENLKAGKTEGIFQFESPNVNNHLKKITLQNFEDITII